MNQKSQLLIQHRLFVTTLSLLLGGLLSGCAAQPQYRIGILSGFDDDKVVIDSFKATMTELGYQEGETVQYEVRQAHGNPAQMQKIAHEFVVQEVDLIVVTTNGGSITVKLATAGTDIPVVFGFTMAVIETGLINSYLQPGGNLTGVYMQPELFADKYFEFLLRLDPTATRVWLPCNPTYPTIPLSLAALHRSKTTTGVELVETFVESPAELLEAIAQFAAMPTLPFDAIMIMPDTTVQQSVSWQALLKFANEHKIPIIANTIDQLKDGALFIYTRDFPNTGEKMAVLGHRILQGADPATTAALASEPYLIINYQTVISLNLTLDEGIRLQADELYK